MKMQKKQHKLLLLFITILCSSTVLAQNSIAINGSADFVSRYVWRGLLVNDSPNIQPSLSLSYSGFSFGFWGSYALAKINKSENDFAVSQEIDTWISYSFKINNGVKISALVTDYYFPQSGIRIGNFNNYDNPAGAGAHTLELGLSLTGNDSFPLSIAGYINIYNDKGNNSYFQVDYSTNISSYEINIFIGAAGGSKKNPGYYGADKFNVINLGITAQRNIKVTDSFSIPISVSYILNPKAEISYLIFGLSI